MSAPSPDFVAHVVDLLSTLGPVRTRRMFGGFGVYADDVFIAILLDDTLFLKVDDVSRSKFEEAGCRPFVYEAKGKQVSVNYMTCPDDAMESPPLMRPWARLAMGAGLRALAAMSPAERAAKRAPTQKPARKTPPARKAAPPKPAAKTVSRPRRAR